MTHHEIPDNVQDVANSDAQPAPSDALRFEVGRAELLLGLLSGEDEASKRFKNAFDKLHKLFQRFDERQVG